MRTVGVADERAGDEVRAGASTDRACPGAASRSGSTHSRGEPRQHVAEHPGKHSARRPGRVAEAYRDSECTNLLSEGPRPPAPKR